MQSPSMYEQKTETSVTWNDSPTVFDHGQHGAKPKIKPATANRCNTPWGNRAKSRNTVAMDSDSILDHNLTIESILRDIGMTKYIKKFHLEEIDLYVFTHMEPKDLYELDIDEEDHETLLDAIQIFSM